MRKKLQGTVRSAKNEKTLRVDVARLYRHKKYGKIVSARTVCYAHDENKEAQEGDVVEIIESRPYSKTKRWEFVRVVRRGGVLVDPGAVAAPGERDEEAANAEQESAEQATE